MAKKRRRPPQELIGEITTRDDGIRPVRDIQSWTLNKLGILRSYLPAFAKACQTAPGGCFFVDGLAGPGLCHLAESDRWLLGSTLIALATDPPFTKCLAMDLDERHVEALRRRTADFAPRIVVRRGDCNLDLVRAMDAEVPRTSPVLGFLDPEGTELHWKTVEAVARQREGGRKSELLVLLATSFLDRMLPLSSEIEAHNLFALNRVFPTPAWQQTYAGKLAGEITAEQGRRENVRTYENWLRDDVGYQFVISRSVTQPGSEASVYHLIFATDHLAGQTIMSDVFRNMFPNEPNLRLPGLLD